MSPKHHPCLTNLRLLCAPSRPDSIHLCAFRRLSYEFDVCIVVIIRSTRDLHKLVRQLHVLGVDSDIFWCGHGHQRHRLVIPKRPDGPHSHTSHKLDRGQSIIRHQHTEHKICKRGSLVRFLPVYGMVSLTVGAKGRDVLRQRRNATRDSSTFVRHIRESQPRSKRHICVRTDFEPSSSRPRSSFG